MRRHPPVVEDRRPGRITEARIAGAALAPQVGVSLDGSRAKRNFLGFPIPTLCHMEGLTPYGACRLCVVEIGTGRFAKLVSACTYPAEEGLQVRTASSSL